MTKFIEIGVNALATALVAEPDSSRDALGQPVEYAGAFQSPPVSFLLIPHLPLFFRDTLLGTYD